MKKIFLTCLLSTLLCVSVFAQTPNPAPTPPVNTEVIAKLEGPSQIVIGNTARFLTEGSVGSDFKWLIFPKTAEEELTIYKLDGADTPETPKYLALFESKKAGSYILTLIVTKDNKSDAVQVELVNGDTLPNPNPNPNPDPGPNPNPNPTPVVVVPDIPTPSPYLQAIVAPIKTKMIGPDIKKDAAELANFYNDMANVIERDTADKINTTGAVRELNINAGTLMFQNTGMKGKYVGLAEAVDTALVQVLTLENVNLSLIKQNDTVNIFRSISWIFVQIYNQN